MKLRLLFALFTTSLLFGLQAQINTVGIIGTATPGGWDFDTDLIQDGGNPDLWTLQLDLIDGLAKFRANDDWAINWGSSAFPAGTGTQDGADIPVTAGLHDITFNSATGEYHISVVSDIGIIGSATPFEWAADINLYQDASDPDVYTLSTGLIAGVAKFRQDDDWIVNWGAMDFPSGVGVQDGPDIPIPVGGDYNISFNKATGEYNFVLTSFATVGLIGDATGGGWDTPTPMNSGTTAGAWTVNAILMDGGVQFSGDNGAVIWGGTDFPSGTATLDGDTINVPAGRYLVNFSAQTLAYEFVPVVYYSTVGIIGDATPGGWDPPDTDMERDPVDSSLWTLRIILGDGVAKFRADDDWLVNWGGADFPNGTAVQDGPDIPITAGEYNITFNSFTGVYSFFELRIPDRVGLVGAGTPTMSWDVDFFLTQDETDENVWTYNSIDLNGEVKFRADSAWTVNWGAMDFPTGTGTQDGPNIPVAAGTYGITFNSASGEYAFGDPLSATKDVLNPSSIKAYPNPAADLLHLDLSAVDLHGEVNLTVFDINGRVVLSEVQPGNTQMNLGVSALPNGYYSLQISSDKYIIGKKFIIARK